MNESIKVNKDLEKMPELPLKLKMAIRHAYGGGDFQNTITYEPRHEKNGFLHMRKQRRRSAFVFALQIVQSHYYLYPKFQASSHLLWLYSLVCVGPGRKPQRPRLISKTVFLI